MNKNSFALLFAISILVVGIFNIYRAGPSSCSEWASKLLSGVKHCETTVLNITPDDVVGLYEWRVGSIRLSDSHIDNVFGITFYDQNGSSISPDDMQQNVTYYFNKTLPSSSFHLWPNEEGNVLLK